MMCVRYPEGGSKTEFVVFVMLYVAGKLFSKVEHIDFSDLCVYFKGFMAKKLQN